MPNNNSSPININDIPADWDKNELSVYLRYILSILMHLYQNEYSLFENNLCERCISFRFAHLLQNIFNTGTGNTKYFVDCDYNSSFYYDETCRQWVKRTGKPILDQNSGKLTKRFVDIIVHQRKYEQPSDLICFEIKKWNNCTKEGAHKDINNLIQLTSHYGYSFGFHLVFGKQLSETKLRIVKENKSLLIEFATNVIEGLIQELSTSENRKVK